MNQITEDRIFYLILYDVQNKFAAWDFTGGKNFVKVRDGKIL
jgi:hypothetical protein